MFPALLVAKEASLTRACSDNFMKQLNTAHKNDGYSHQAPQRYVLRCKAFAKIWFKFLNLILSSQKERSMTSPLSLRPVYVLLFYISELIDNVHETFWSWSPHITLKCSFGICRRCWSNLGSISTTTSIMRMTAAKWHAYCLWLQFTETKCYKMFDRSYYSL